MEPLAYKEGALLLQHHGRGRSTLLPPMRFGYMREIACFSGVHVISFYKSRLLQKCQISWVSEKRGTVTFE